MPRNPLVGALEAGGTKLVCAVGRGPGERILDRASFRTGDDPAKALGTIVEWLKQREVAHGRLAALGVACFGPVDLDERSPTYGFITTTPKPGWAWTNVLGRLHKAFPGVPLGFETDVNGAALGEWRWGAAKGLEDFAYITAGTGIGGGAMVGGKLIHGLMHPEMGHMSLPRLPKDDFAGTCPFHGPCWEGLCSGPALARRTGLPVEELPPDHPAWETTMHYMAQALVNLTCVLSPRRIILGGGVRKAGRLGEDRFFQGIRFAFRSLMAGYVSSPALSETGIAEFITPPLLGDDAGICGAMALAQDKIRNQTQNQVQSSKSAWT